MHDAGRAVDDPRMHRVAGWIFEDNLAKVVEYITGLPQHRTHQVGPDKSSPWCPNLLGGPQINGLLIRQFEPERTDEGTRRVVGD
jgi:hypothetical protein